MAGWMFKFYVCQNLVQFSRTVEMRKRNVYLGRTEHAVGSVAVIPGESACSPIFMQIDGNVGRKRAEERLDITRLLTHELRVVSVGIKVCRQRPLEIFRVMLVHVDYFGAMKTYSRFRPGCILATQ